MTKGQELEAQHQVGLVQPLEGSPVPESWEDVYKAFDGQITDLPSDWDLVDKATLVGKPFIIYSFTLRDGDFGRPYVSVNAVLEGSSPGAPVSRVVFNDGSTGIAAQLKEMAAQGIMGGIRVTKGLRVSEYEFTGSDGITKPAKTYYLS